MGKKRLKRPTREIGIPEKRDVSGSTGINGESYWFPFPSLAGVTVTPETALALSAVYACVTIISSHIACLPLDIYKCLPSGGRIPDRTAPNWHLVSCEPNPEMDAVNFWQSIVGHACLYGNGYAEIQRSWDGRAVALWLLDSRSTFVKRKPSGELYYETFSSIECQGRPTTLIPDNVLHIKNFGHDGLVGMSPIFLARDSIGTLMAAEKAGAASLGNATTPVGMIEVEDEMDEEGRKNLRIELGKVHQGPTNAGKIAILEGSYKYTPFTCSLADIQYIEQRKFGVSEISRIYSVPMNKLAELDGATFSNVEEQNIDFYSNCIRIWCDRVSSEINRKLFYQSERHIYYAQHNMQAALRGNAVSQADYLTKMLGTGGVDVDGVCIQAGLNPVGGEMGKLRFVSANLIPLSQPALTAPDTDQDQSLPATVVDGDSPVSDTALNGAQIASLLQIVEAVTSGILPKTSAESLIMASFPNIGKDQIEAIVKDIVPGSQPGLATASPDAARSIESVRNVVRDAIKKAVYKESQAVGRAAKKENFTEWKSQFYGEHREFLQTSLSPSLAALSAVSGKEISTEELVDKMIDQSTMAFDTQEPDAVLASWSNRVATIMEGI